MIHLENGHIYELTSDFDIYSCDDGKITVKAGAVFVAERGNNRIINGRELPFYNIYILRSKSYLPYSSACIFQSISGITIKEITMDMLDKEVFAGYLPWNIRFGTNSSIRAMQKMMEERK